MSPILRILLSAASSLLVAATASSAGRRRAPDGRWRTLTSRTIMPRTTLLIGVALLIALLPHPVGAGDITVDGKFVSTVPTGTPPLQVDSSTLVPNLNADLLGGLPASAFSPEVGNLIRVAKTGGHFSSIQAALDSITDAGIDNWYVVLVGPGVYHESITLKNFVSVVGHGRYETRIQAEETKNVIAVQGSTLSVLSDIWIVARSTDGGDATGVNAPVFLVQRSQIEAHASAPGQAIGLRATGSVDVDLVDTEVRAMDGAVNTGVYIESPAYFSMRGGEVRGQSPSNAAATNYGVRKAFVSGFSSLTLEDVTVIGSLGAVGYGIRSEGGGIGLRRSGVFGGGSSTAVGVYNGENTSFTVADSNIAATGTASTRRGFEQAAGTVTIRGCTLTGASALHVASGATARVAYSQVSVSLTGTGTFDCIGLYDLGMSPVSCP